MIYYIGLNDRYIHQKRWHDYEEELNFLQNLYAYITQNSL